MKEGEGRVENKRKKKGEKRMGSGVEEKRRGRKK